MNSSNDRGITVALSTLRSWLVILAVIWLFSFIGLGWLVKSFLILLVLVALTPVVALLGLRWWLNRALVQGNCPTCGFKLTALNNTQTRCPNCSESLKIDKRQIQRLTPPGTIDVQAVEVAAQVVDEDT